MKFTVKISLIVAILFAISVPLYAQVSSNGLILYFSFDKASGDKVPDLSKGKHDGALKSNAKITATAKLGGGALEITDQNANLEVAGFKEMDEYQDNSYVFWLYFTAGSNGAWSQIFAKLVTSPASDRAPGCWINPGSLGIHYRYNAGNMGTDAIGPGGEGKAFEQKVWYHVAGVKKGNELAFYVNKKEERKVTVPAKHAQGVGNLYIGKSPSFRAATFIIDEFAIFNRALTANEVAAAMDSGVTAINQEGKLSTAWGNIKSR